MPGEVVLHQGVDPTQSSARPGGWKKMRLRNTTPAIDAAARRLRLEQTGAESRLWAALRRGRLGVHFRRQHPLGTIIVDFACPSARLVIEVDGGVHRDTAARDRARDDMLRAAGYHVLRFTNREVERRLPVVLEAITRVLAR